MTVSDWYDPARHERFPAVPDLKDVGPTDTGALLAAHEQRRREREVKLAHFRLVEEKMKRCYLRWGVHSFKQHCQHLIVEFNQTKDELSGWKESARILEQEPGKHMPYKSLEQPATDDAKH